MEETPATDFPFALERFAFTEAPVDTELRTSESSLKKTTNLARFTPFKRVLIQLGQNIPSALGSPRFPKLCLLYLPGLVNFIHGKKQTNKKKISVCISNLRMKLKWTTHFQFPMQRKSPQELEEIWLLLDSLRGKKNPPAVKELLIQVATLINWRMRRYLPLKRKEKQGESLTLKAQQSTQIPVKPTQVRAENCNSRVVTITASWHSWIRNPTLPLPNSLHDKKHLLQTFYSAAD